MTNFPIINSLKDIETAIAGRSEFNIYEREWGFVANYQVSMPDTFPIIETNQHALLRECRGIKFDKNGKLIARTLHKFFNVGERLETLPENINFNRKFILLDKLDGSMIHPIWYNNQVVYCTKAGITDTSANAQVFADNHVGYNDFAKKMMIAGFTPTFEWTSRKNRIVVDYPNDNLILTAIRENLTGRYLSHEEMVHVAEGKFDVVAKWDGTFTDINNFVAHVKDMENNEGYILRFTDGNMLKIKNFWYMQLHKTKDLMQHEKDVWGLILGDKVDDALSFMEEADKKKLTSFQKLLLDKIASKAETLKWEVIAWRDNHGESKKKFAVDFINKSNFTSTERGLLFKIWDGHDAYDIVYNYIKAHISTGPKLQELRHLVDDISWDYVPLEE